MNGSYVLVPGDTVVRYTDGLVERRGAPLDEGTAWLLRALESAGECTVEELCDRLLHEVDPDTDDDIALLVVRTHPAGPTGGQQTRPAGARLLTGSSPRHRAGPVHPPQDGRTVPPSEG